MNRAGEARTRAKKAVAALARECGISRQTVYAIESGAFVPNAITALRLARALNSTVEELFPLPEENRPPRKHNATMLPGTEGAMSRAPLVRLGRVGKRLIAVPAEPEDAFLPEADATAGNVRGTTVSVIDADAEYSGRVLLAGCDPALSQLKSMGALSHLQIALCQASSGRALDWLKRGFVHVAGCHVRGATGEYNLPLIKRMFRDSDVRVVTFAKWQQGLVVARGNPKSIRTAADLGRRPVRLINRETGAGSRELLDEELRKAGISVSEVRGYDTFANGHLDAAQRVHTGQADCCMATEAAARFLGLDFIPISAERFDLVIRTQSMEHSGVKTLLDVLQAAQLRWRLATLAGYDTAETGARLL